MTAIADIVTHYGWREVIAIYTDDDHGRNGISALGDKLVERRCRISYKAVLPPDLGATQAEITDALVKVALMESRIIVVHTYSNSGLMVFDMAKHLRMIDAGYVWIATTWLSTVLDSKSPFSKLKAFFEKGGTISFSNDSNLHKAVRKEEHSYSDPETTQYVPFPTLVADNPLHSPSSNQQHRLPQP
ncbi:hypothetical protein IFM89_008273 [Coptis chinensis]|uniref:Receptor ligand binding region domain-containing protein n=1 Tax=Coptis chinensis TaxID=261450 RepID=A0A835LAJ0_9MAGN|nr:hypothetical protein IFM89_008273 [Coptis chinensis]